MADDRHLQLLRAVFANDNAKPVNVFGDRPQVTDEEQRRKLAGMDPNIVQRGLEAAQQHLNSGAQSLDQVVGSPKMWPDPTDPRLVSSVADPKTLDQIPRVGFFEGLAHSLPAAAAFELQGRSQTAPASVAGAAFPSASRSLQRLREEAVLRDQMESQQLLTPGEAAKYAEQHPTVQVPANLAEARLGEAPKMEPSRLHKGISDWLRTPGVGDAINGENTNMTPDAELIPEMQDRARDVQNQHADAMRGYGIDDASGWDSYRDARGGTSNWRRDADPNLTDAQRSKLATPDDTRPNVLGRTLSAMSNNIDRNVHHDMWGLVSAEGEFPTMGSDYWDRQMDLELDNEAKTAGPGSMADESVPVPRPAGWVDEAKRKPLEEYVRRWGHFSGK